MKNSFQTKVWVGRVTMIMIPLLVVVGLLWMGPIPQPTEYHQFADQRTLLGIPNFWDVVSNLPFLIIGLLGLKTVASLPAPGVLPLLRPAYFFFFLGTALIGLGSGYYHLEPNHETLVWDRLPMTVAFMAFFAMIVGEHFTPRAGASLLFPLLAVGVLSVVYWMLTERAGRGDLRPYIFVQFVPVVLVPAILLIYRSVFDRVWYFWVVLGSYAVAKGLEYWDAPIFHCGELLGGHALKHLAAAVGTYFVLRAMTHRKLQGQIGQPIRSGT